MFKIIVKIFKEKISLLFLIFAIVFAVLTFIGGIISYSPVPFWDMWNGYLNFYVKVSSGDWSVWWSQHNEHRIVISRLLFWLDIAIFHGQGVFLIVINYLLIGLICFVFWLSWKENSNKTIPWVGFFLISWIFSWIQQDNLTWGFQSQFFLAQLLPLVSLYLMHRAAKSENNPNRYFYLSVFSGVLAIGTMANGILVLPLITAYAILSRMRWKRSAVLTALSVVAIFLYFHDFKDNVGHGSLSQALRENPFGLLHYVLLYLGGPFYYFFEIWGIGHFVATITGIFMVGSSIAFAWRVVPIAHKATLSLAMLLFILYVGGSALGTGGGRLIFGVDQALSSRYMTPALMAWAALLILYLPSLEILSHSERKKIWIPFLLLLLLMLPQQFNAFASKKNILFEREIAALALEIGVKDKIQINNIFPSADEALLIAEVPVEKNISIFGKFPIKDARSIIGEVAPKKSLSDQRCQGAIDEVQPIEGDSHYLKVRGWFFDLNRRLAPKSAQLVDGDGVVQGVVLTGQSRPDVASAIDIAAGTAGFKGYVKVGAQGKAVIFIDADGGCQFTATIPPIFFTTSKVTDSSFVNTFVSQVQGVNEWKGSDYYRSSISDLSVFGSFINSDSDQGSIIFSLNRGDRLFYRSGPNQGRQIAQVIERPELITSLPLASEWILLDFSSDLLPEYFNVRFSDNGDGWGEWSAVGLKLPKN